MDGEKGDRGERGERGEQGEQGESASETKLLVLINSVENLSRITANHDTLLTKLVDDHEQRIRGLETVCARYDAMIEKHINMVREIDAVKARVSDIEIQGSKVAKDSVAVCDTLEDRVRALENWRWYTIGAIAVIVPAGAIIARLLVP